MKTYESQGVSGDCRSLNVLHTEITFVNEMYSRFTCCTYTLGQSMILGQVVKVGKLMFWTVKKKEIVHLKNQTSTFKLAHY